MKFKKKIKSVTAYDFPMIGPTLKLKRHVAVKKFAAQIDAMYEPAKL